MIEFGKTLRTMRESKGLTTGQVAERTHMLIQTIEGLEAEDFSKIVAPIYGRGFVKLYCEAVGLEPKPLVDAFMEAYSNRHNAGKKEIAPAEPRHAAQSPESTSEGTPATPEPPKGSQATMDFVAPEPPAEHPYSSRYAAPPPIDDGFSMPFVNWRMVALGASALAIVVLAILGIRAVYRVTMTAPESEEPAAVSATDSSASAAPSATGEPQGTQKQARVADRKPLPLKYFYIDSDHSTEQEKK